MNNRKAVYIPSIDAKDIYMANHFNDEEDSKFGFKLHNKRGEINYKKYINSLDYSLDLIKLREIAKDILPKKNPFEFSYLNKDYSNKVINVTFKYAYRTFNKIKRNTFVKAGYKLEDLVFDDCLAYDDEEIVGIITKESLKKSVENLPKGFKCQKNDKGENIYVDKVIPVLKTVRELRDYVYKEGFTCEGQKYIRFKRSSGSARVGKCLFIDERLYPKMHKWEMCGLNIKEGDECDLAALEAYISLPTSSIIDTLEIESKNILVISDYDSEFEDDCIVTRIGEDKWLHTTEEKFKVTNSIFDGQSLIDKSLMCEYDKYGMLLLRNRFFKSCCFNTNIQKWFEDNGITEISQLPKEYTTLAENISDIKLITTPNSIKFKKFGSLEQWLKTIDTTFGIVKHEKKTHFFDGKMVQAHYQLLNTIRLSKDEVKELLKPSLQYISYINTIPEVFRYHIKCSIDDNFNPDSFDTTMLNKNEIFYKMMNLSKDFVKTKIYYDFKKDTCTSYIKNMKKGHILIDGNYSVLLGNPYEMLLHSIGKFDGTTSLPPGNVHTLRYEFNQNVLGCRSPHISTSNILISNNMEHKLIDKYFNLTTEIVCINSIGENILQRLSGADFDSDSMIVSNDKIIIDAALKYYRMFKVPVNAVEARKQKRYYTNEDKADLDFKTSNNKIGEIVNLSQELNTIMWTVVNDPENKDLSNEDLYEKIKEIYYDICQLSVMSGIEIDKAKKEFEVLADKEISKIKEKHLQIDEINRVIKPGFLGYIAKLKDYYNDDKKNYKFQDTTMDYLIEIISNSKAAKSKVGDFIPLYKCFEFEGYSHDRSNEKQIAKIIDLCNETDMCISKTWATDYYEVEEKFRLTEYYQSMLYEKINSLKINKHTMFELIKFVNNKKYSKISRLLFYAIFNYHNDSISDLLSNMDRASTYLKYEDKGDISLYNIKYTIKDVNLHN